MRMVVLPNRFYKSVSFFLLFCVLLFLRMPDAKAEQTIINIPSSEILPAGDMIIKQSNRFDAIGNDKFMSLTPNVIMGIGHGIELSTGVGASVQENKTTNVIGGFSAKKVWFLGPQTRVTTGGTISPYYSRVIHPNSFIYSHLSHRIKKTRTSITAGGYMSGEKHSVNDGGVLLGIEQVVLSNKLRLALDWLSSQDSYGRMGVGIKYRPVPTLSITSAIILPNKDNKNVAFNVSLSKFIALDEENPIKRRLKSVD